MNTTQLIGDGKQKGITNRIAQFFMDYKEGIEQKSDWYSIFIEFKDTVEMPEDKQSAKKIEKALKIVGEECEMVSRWNLV